MPLPAYPPVRPSLYPLYPFYPLCPYYPAMCRFTLYLGPPITLSALLLEPTHSLIRQSTHAREREEPLNGDGFGVGWYQPTLTDEPSVFRSITPAWNNRNLHNLARVVASPTVLAHVRAATHSSGVNEANCHPFRYRQLLFMHNGDIGNFPMVRRRLLASVSDQAFGNVYGSTDSEHLFAMVIDEMAQSHERDPARKLTVALANAIRRAVAIVTEHGENAPSYLNVAISDGDHAAVSRFCSDADDDPESLYFYYGPPLYALAYGTGPRRRRSEEITHAVIVSSERLTDDPGWEAIPPNHMIVIRRGVEPDVVGVS